MEWYLNDHYDYYVNERRGMFSKKIYKKVINEFNKMLIGKLLTGIPVNLGGRLGSMQICRAHRNFKNTRVNWGATNKRKEQLLKEGKKLYDNETGEGEEYLVLHTDDDYCYIHWYRIMCSVPNKTVYRFISNRGKKGLSTRLKQFIKDDPINKLNFSFTT
jgi:hypothetical protein